jgi:hypothetical protein
MIPRNLKHVGPYARPAEHAEQPRDSAGEPLLDDCKGALKHPDGGLYLPWVPRITPEQLKQWQRELFEVVDELAKLEGWPDSDYDHVVMCIERQPISTLRPDLGYFRDRLEAALATLLHCQRSDRTGDPR